MSDLFYNQRHRRTDIFSYRINSKTELEGVIVQESGDITIIFEDGKFNKVNFPFQGNYSRSAWKVLAAIEAEICRLEKSFNLLEKNDGFTR